jgi:hypothetical protein
MTYANVHKSGKFLGGGIGPGLNMRFVAMEEATGALPRIEPRLYTDMVNSSKSTAASPALKIFETDTRKQMMSSVLTECAYKLRALVNHFLEEQSSNDMQDEDNDESTKPVVLLTGGDSVMYEALLKENHGGIVPVEKGTSDPSSRVQVTRQKHLLSRGVYHALSKKMDEADKEGRGRDEDLRDMLVGLRVAKEFPQPDYDGEKNYRGTILNCIPGRTFEQDLYYVRYDDQDSEKVSPGEIVGKRKFRSF